MRVLVTGASGDVGSKVREVLENSNVEVIPISSKKRKGFVQWDLTKPTVPPQLITDTIDAVVSCVDGKRQLKHILTFTKQYRIKHFIYIGSIVTELHGIEDSYTKNKANYGNLTRTFCSQHNIQYSIVCPSMVHDKDNNWDKKIKRASPICCFIWPFFHLYLTSGQSVGEAVLDILKKNHASKLVVLGEKRTFGEIYNYYTFFIMVVILLSVLILVNNKPTKYISSTILILILILNLAVLSLAHTYKSLNILIH